MLISSVTTTVFLAGAFLLASTCFAASGLEEKQDAKALSSPAGLAVGFNSTNAVSALAEGLTSEDAEVRFNAIRQMMKAHLFESSAQLKDILTDKDGN